MNRKNRQKLKALQKQNEEASKRYKQLIDDAKSSDDRQQLFAESRSELSVIEYCIDELVTKDLTTEAYKLSVPIPDRSNEKWWADSALNDRTKHLTTEGIQELRKSLREEKKERIEAKGLIVDIAAKIITILTGLIGAAIGLAAILKS